MQDVGGAELPYLYYEGEAPQILFAHATGFLPWLWHPIIEDLVSLKSGLGAVYLQLSRV